MIGIFLLIFIISCIVLVKSGTLVVKALTRIAQFLKWREFILSFILMAFATSIPEFFVSVASAWHFRTDLAFGNIIGSNIINLTLVIAISVFIAKELTTKSPLFQKTSFYTILISLLPVILILDKEISRADGIILLFCFFFYFLKIYQKRKDYNKIISDHLKRDFREFKLFLKDLGMFFASLLGLLISAEIIVRSALFIADFFNCPLVIIGTLIIAFGTNLPEIIFGIKSITLGHKEMVLGGVLGSVVVNSSLILGVSFLISPLKISKFSPYIIGIIFTLLVAFFFFIFEKTNRKITKREGGFLLILYFLFVFFEIFVK